MADEVRVPVQGERGKPDGTVPWATHFAAWRGYQNAGHGVSQSATRVAERGGFGYRELQCAIAGHYNDVVRCQVDHPMPEGWRARD